MKIKHFVINLERRVERLWAWIGAQDRMDMPIIEDVTIFYGVDAHMFETISEIIQHAKKHGLTDLPDKNPSSANFTDLGALGLRLSYEFLLRKIAHLESDTWYVIWLDDVVLTRPYEDFKNLICNAPSDAKIITVNNRLSLSQGRRLKRSRQYRFYHGTVGNTADLCMAFLPEGAKRIVEIGENNKLVYYEAVLENFYREKYADTDMSGIYTPAKNFARSNCVSRLMADIWVNPERAVLETMRYKEVL